MRYSPAFACILLSGVLHAQKLEDFTGTWRVDPSKIEEKATPIRNPGNNAPDVPPPPPPEHKYTLEQIRRSGDLLKISGGEAGTTAVYTIDPGAKQVSDPIPDAPGSVRIASTHWSDGQLVTEWRMERNGKEFMHGTDVHRIGPDGLLIVNRVIESPVHRAEVRLVLARVP